jgi:hypothetical protein
MARILNHDVGSIDKARPSHSFPRMNRLLAALLLCVLQICQVHCFAEQAGLMAQETCACCAAEDSAPPAQTNPCDVCDIVRTGVVATWPVFKCTDPAWSHLIVVPIPQLATSSFAETTLSQVRTWPEAADPPEKLWAALVRTALPVRGPSIA